MPKPRDAGAWMKHSVQYQMIDTPASLNIDTPARLKCHQPSHPLMLPWRKLRSLGT